MRLAFHKLRPILNDLFVQMHTKQVAIMAKRKKRAAARTGRSAVGLKAGKAAKSSRKKAAKSAASKRTVKAKAKPKAKTKVKTKTKTKIAKKASKKTTLASSVKVAPKAAPKTVKATKPKPTAAKQVLPKAPAPKLERKKISPPKPVMPEAETVIVDVIEEPAPGVVVVTEYEATEIREPAEEDEDEAFMPRKPE